MTWYAIQHKPAQGDRALAHLQNQGVSCFYPKVEVERICGGKRCRRLEPLFPGYLFVNLDDANPVWSRLRSTRGVLRVVGFGNRPAPIEDDVIDHIRASVATVAAHGGIRPGQTIELEEGPFKGLQAVFQAYDGEERAIVLISFMQSRQRIRVPLKSLKV